MTHNGWSPMRRLIRRKTLKEMFKIYTTSGSVVTTEDHSLLFYRHIDVFLRKI